MKKVMLTDSEMEVVLEALNHVWREVFDSDMTGKGGTLRSAIAKLAIAKIKPTGKTRV